MEDFKDVPKGTDGRINLEQRGNSASGTRRVDARGIFFHRFEHFIALRISEGRRPNFPGEVIKYIEKGGKGLEKTRRH